MGRDTPYAYMAGQGYQQQGFNAGAQGQYGNSSYAQQYMAPYALGAQAQPPHMSGQTGSSNAAVSSAQSSNIYKMQ